MSRKLLTRIDTLYLTKKENTIDRAGSLLQPLLAIEMSLKLTQVLPKKLSHLKNHPFEDSP